MFRGIFFKELDWSGYFFAETKAVRYHCDKFAVGRLSSAVVDGVAEV